MSEEKKELDIDLSIYEYCAEDDTYTVRGQLDYEPDLGELKERAASTFSQIVEMEQLEALVIVEKDSTMHLHADGEVVVNGVQSEDEAEELLKKLF